MQHAIHRRYSDADEHQPGKRKAQKMERKHLASRTRIKRLARKTICCSRAMQMHAMVTGLFVSRYGFGYPYETSTSLLKHDQTAHDGTF